MSMYINTFSRCAASLEIESSLWSFIKWHNFNYSQKAGCQLSDAMTALCEKSGMSDARTCLINGTLCRKCIWANSSLDSQHWINFNIQLSLEEIQYN
jgi:hypothetical protein